MENAHLFVKQGAKKSGWYEEYMVFYLLPRTLYSCEIDILCSILTRSNVFIMPLMLEISTVFKLCCHMGHHQSTIGTVGMGLERYFNVTSMQHCYSPHTCNSSNYHHYLKLVMLVI